MRTSRRGPHSRRSARRCSPRSGSARRRRCRRRPPSPPAPPGVEASNQPQGDARFKLLATRAPVGIYEADRDGRFTFVNLRWSEIAGLAWEEALGRGWLRAVHPDDRDHARDRWEEAVAARRPFAEELRFGDDGRIRWVWSEAVELTGDDGVVIGYLGTIVDVTERRAAEARASQARSQLERHATELQRSNSDLEQFAYVASHDLSEPLHVIGGFVELLGKHYAGALDEDGRRFIANALGGVERMQELIDDLLAYSRLGRAELVLREVDSAVVVAEVLETLESRRREVGAEIVAGELPTVRAERRMLTRLFQNLLSNALKFAGEAPRVEVTSERADHAWQFSIADDGPGIAPAQVERAFEMFQRLHGRDVPGTGIGLPICRRIAERHGGGLTYVRGEDGGSVFLFTIPD